MTVRRLACVDAQGELLGYIVCEDDAAYEAAIKQLGKMDLNDRRPGDLPTLEELAARSVQ